MLFDRDCADGVCVRLCVCVCVCVCARLCVRAAPQVDAPLQHRWPGQVHHREQVLAVERVSLPRKETPEFSTSPDAPNLAGCPAARVKLPCGRGRRAEGPRAVD